MSLHSFVNIAYLKTGTPRQREVYELLTQTQLFERISQYTPVLCGTIPIGVDLPNSDLDIICEVHGFERFEEEVTEVMATLGATDVYSRRKQIRATPSHIIGCTWGGLAVEFFGQPQSVTNQYAFRHMMIEHRLLVLGGRPVHDEVMAQRRNGLKTEPAFANVLGLTGDPFEALLQFEDWTDERLAKLLTRATETTR